MNNSQNLLLRWPMFQQWTLLGIWHSLTIYVSVYSIWYNDPAILPGGKIVNLW